jgi:hypothetical protein
MPRKEELNEEYLKRRVKETGGETRKVKWVQHRGAPDRLCGWPNGRHAYVEVKEDSQPWGLQPHQAREHQKMLRWGMQVTVLGNKAAIDSFIKVMTA